MHGNLVRPTNDFVKFEREEMEQSMPEHFEKQVARYGDRIATKDESHELTYDELNKRANHIARAILEKRDQGQEPVAILLSQGIPGVCGILGVVKSGKIYMPLASWFPRARNEYMLRDSQADLIITDDKNLSLAHKLAQDNIQLLNIDELNPNLSVENLHLSIKPDDSAWLFYTSGSTGQPKGVYKCHRANLHAIMDAVNDMHICIHDRLASFGLSESSFWPAISNGASIHYLDIRERGLSDAAEWLIQEEITICTLVVTAFRHFVDTLMGNESFPRLRLLRLVSEPVYKRDIELYKKHFSPDCILINQMAITEAGVIARYFIDKKTQIDDAIVPVGYLTADSEVLLLNEHGKEVAPNQIGEIAVRSRYLCEGYWRRPDLTQARFLPDPDGGDKRIYMSGDLGRMLPDGRLVHLGRKDFQLKIRGHRIEVVEIEMALLDLDAIKEAVVVARDDSHSDQRLVAYLVPVENSNPTVSMLRRALAESLPDYMVPSAFVMMDALPLTPTGKLDRKSLPDPGTARPELDAAFVAPRTPSEEKLTGVWSDVLGLDEVGIHDDFFDLGGNSLLATQIISRVINTFQVRVPLSALFRSPTVADMAVVLVHNMTEKAEIADIDKILSELEKLSEDELKMMLDDESS
ncbi:AMP-binding protein [Candidatus Poribacteria bacterium]